MTKKRAPKWVGQAAPPAQPAKKPGNEHVPDALTRRTVNTLSAVGLSQARIAANLQISEPTLRFHYRRELDCATELMVGNALGRLVKASQEGLGMASVKASLAILVCRGGWRETSKLEIEQPLEPGIGGLIEFVEKARAAKARAQEDRAIEAAEDAAYEKHLPEIRH